MRGPLTILGSSAVLGASLLLPAASAQKTDINPPAKVTNQKAQESKVHLVALSEAGKKWIENQRDVLAKTRKNESGGLIDASTFLSGSQKKKLDALAGKKGGFGITRFQFKKLNQKENGYQYALDVDYYFGEKERWYLSGSPYYRDQFPDDEPLSIASLAIWKGTKNGGVDKLTQHEIRYENIVKTSGSIDFEYLLRMIDEAKASRKSELRDAAKIRDFDLPKNELIGYIGLADPNVHCDPVMCGVVEDVGHFSELMNQAGYKFVVNKKGRNAIPVTSNPKKIIEEEVEAFRRAGVRNIYLKLSAHGNETLTGFLGKEGYNLFTSRDLVDILNKFQDCKFTILTDACHNGGLSDAIKRYKDPSKTNGRIHLFVQSKISGFNQEGRLKDIISYADIRFFQVPSGLVSVPVLYKANIAPKAFSSYYSLFFYNHILNGEPYGRAHIKADEDAKKLVPCDAGIIKSTPRGGITTSMLEQGSGVDPAL